MMGFSGGLLCLYSRYYDVGAEKDCAVGEGVYEVFGARGGLED